MVIDWTSIIVTLIGTGGFTGLFLISEKKTKAALANMLTMYNILKQQHEDLILRYNAETDKVGKLYDQISKLHEEKDDANTRAATSEMKCCDFISCSKRRPPIADNWRMDLDKEEKGEGE